MGKMKVNAVDKLKKERHGYEAIMD